jgi:hypothetical protein
MPAMDDIVLNIGGMDAFERSYLPVLERFADRVQELPMLRTAFSEPGGALICAVRSSMLALRTCDATIFSPTATAAQRLETGGQYRWLAFCSVLTTVYLIAAASIDVWHQGATGSDEQLSWADDKNLVEWRSSYKMSWVNKPTYATARLLPFVQPLFFPGQFAHLPRAMLNDFGASINPALVGSSAEPSLARVVRQSIEKVISDEKSLSATWVSNAAVAGLADAGGPLGNIPSSIPTTEAHTSPGDSVSSGHGVHGHATAGHGHGEQAGILDSPGGHHIDPDTGEIRSAAPKETPEQIKAREFLVGLAASNKASAVTILAGNKIAIEKTGLSFATTPSAAYSLLHKAGLVLARSEAGVVTLNERAHAIWLDAQKTNTGAQA